MNTTRPNTPAATRSRTTPTAVLFASLVAAGLAAPSAQAANKFFDITNVTGLTAGSATWDSGTTSAWATSSNPLLANPGLWANGDDAFFQTAGANTVTLGANLTANSITQTTNSTATTINKGTGTNITLTTGNITNSGNSAFVINPDIILGANGTFNAGNTITLNGIVSGVGFGVTKKGASTVTLTADNTYTGTTTVSAGTMAVNGAAGKLSGTTAVVINGGGTLQLGDATNGLVDRINTAASLTLGGAGGGTLSILRGPTTANSQSFASLSVNAGSNTIINSGTTGGVPTVTFTGAGSSVYTRNAGGFVSLGASNINESFTNAPTGSSVAGGLLIGAAFNGTGDFVAAQSGTVAAVSHTGGTNIWGAGINTTVTLDSTLASGSTTNSILFNNSTLRTVTLAGTNTITSGGIMTGGGATNGGTITGGTLQTGISGGDLWVYLNGKALTINSVIGDNNTSSLSVGGSSTLTLGGANSYKGATNIASGATLAISATGSLDAASAVTVNTSGILTNSGTIAGATTVAGGTLTNNSTISGSSTVNAGTLTNNSTIAGATVAGGTLNLAGGSSTGAVALTSGTLNLAGGSSTGALTLTGGNLNLTGSTAALSMGTINGTGTGVIAVNNTSASGNTLTFANNSSFATINPGVNAVFTLNNGGGTTSFTNFLQFDNAGAGSGATTTLDGGTWNAATMGSNSGSSRFGGTLNITNGAVLNATNVRYGAHGTTNIGGTSTGTLNIGAGQWSMESSAQAVTYNVQNGGTLTSASAFSLSIVSVANTAYSLVSPKANTIAISAGGSFKQTGNLTIGSSAAGSSISSGTETNTLALSGGKMLVNGTLNQASALTNQTNKFEWTGGQLTAGTVTATNMASGTLTNSAGIFAPGDIGTAGKTTVTGNYTQSSGGTLAIDLGGTTQGSGFQTGQYDFVSVSGNTALDGRLNFNLINAYTPANDTTTLHKILTGATAATSVVTGSFANQVTATGGNSRVVGADGLSSFLIGINNTAATATTGGLTSVTARTVALGGYKATNTYSGAGTAWDTALAGAWTNFDAGATAAPATQASGAIAQFADGTASTNAITVSLNSTRNIQGVQFASASGSRAYTISNGGSGALILDNTGNSASASIADTSTSGTANALNVPITLKSNLAASVSNAANTLTLGGVIGGSGMSLTKSGAGTLVLSGANTYTGATTISGGSLFINGDQTSATGAVSVASGATLGGSGTVGGATTIASGGFLAAGADAASIGTLTFSGNLTSLAGATFSLQLNSTALSTDLLAVTGTATLGSATLALTDLGSTSLSGGQKFTLLTAGTVTGTFFNQIEGSTLRVGANDYTISYLSNAVTLTASASQIPEPATYATLAGLGILILAAYRRRDRKLGARS